LKPYYCRIVCPVLSSMLQYSLLKSATFWLSLYELLLSSALCSASSEGPGSDDS